MRTALLIFSILLMVGSPARGKMKIVASTSDLAFFARQIGGDLVDVDAIAPPRADVHFVEVRPSYMRKLSQADLVLKVGLELDTWMDKIIDGSRRSNLVVVTCSKYIEPLEVPDFKVDARYGDLHRLGNPHYWLGPQNIKPIADVVAEGLSAADPEHAGQYASNRDSLLARLQVDIEALQPRLTTLEGVEVVFYHNTWPYFCAFTGLIAAGFVEPYPGVPASPNHTRDIINLIRARGIRLIAVEPYFDRRVPDKIAQETGAVVVTLYPSIGGRREGETFRQWLEGNVDALLAVPR